MTEPLQPATRPSWPSLLAGAGLLALLLSTQYLFQPFLWAHWSAAEILLGWLELLLNHLLVAACMALAAGVALGWRHDQGLLLLLALVLGAACAEALLMAFERPDAATDPLAWAGRVARWAVLSGAALGLLHVGRHLRAQQAALEEAQQGRTENAAQLTQLQLLALRAQIEPHFLFNTLATVEELARQDRPRSLLLTSHLKTFVRLSQTVLPAAELWTVAQELALVRAYLGVFELRMDGRLQVCVEAEEALLPRELPPLLLATLVENAVKHGITPQRGGGRIDVRVGTRGQELHAEVMDNGAGFVAQSGKGIGLANSRARLRTLYGERARLLLRANQPRGVVASLQIPLEAQA